MYHAKTFERCLLTLCIFVLADFTSLGFVVCLRIGALLFFCMLYFFAVCLFYYLYGFVLLVCLFPLRLFFFGLFVCLFVCLFVWLFVCGHLAKSFVLK